MSKSASADPGIRAADPAPHEAVFLDPQVLLHGQYVRSGGDLTIIAPDGEQTFLAGFFDSSPLPALRSADGSTLISGELAASLAGPAPVQVASVAAEQLAQALDVIGTVRSVKGTVTVTRADGSQVELAAGDEVHAGDVLVTAADGGIGIVFLDDTEFSLGGGGRMVLDELVFDPERGVGQAALSLVTGTFSFVSGQIAKAGPDAMIIKTPAATIGIRGTSGSIAVTSADGEVELQVVLVPDVGGTIGEILLTTAGGQSFSINQAMGALRLAGTTLETFTMSRLEFDQTFGDALSSLPSGQGLRGGIEQVAPPLPQPRQTEQVAPGPDRQPEDQSGGDDDRSAQDLEEALQQALSDPAEESAGETDDTASDAPPVGGEENPSDTSSLFKVTAPPSFAIAPIVFTPVAAAPPPTASSTTTTTSGTTSNTTTTTSDPAPSGGRTAVTVSDQFLDLHGSNLSFAVTGSSLGDHILTGAGDDFISAGGGADLIYAGGGKDTVYGGGGADIIIGAPGAGNDIYYGGTPSSDDSADDWIVYSATTAGVFVSLAAGTASGSEIGTDTIVGIEHADGGSGNDTLIGSAASNWLDGLEGNDRIEGLAGDDYLFGFDGDDLLIGGDGNDWLDGEEGTDTLIGGAGSDILFFGAGPGGTLYGDGTAYDPAASTGDDTYVALNAGVHHHLYDTGGTLDTLDVTHIAIGSFWAQYTDGGDLDILFSDPLSAIPLSTLVTVRDATDGSHGKLERITESGDIFFLTQSASGTAGNDVIAAATAGAAARTIYGDHGDDVIAVRSVDAVYAGDGDDIVATDPNWGVGVEAGTIQGGSGLGDELIINGAFKDADGTVIGFEQLTLGYDSTDTLGALLTAKHNSAMLSIRGHGSGATIDLTITAGANENLLDASLYSFELWDETDYLTLKADSATAAIIKGSVVSDIIFGTDVDGGSGYGDTLYGGMGDDILYGGLYKDTFGFSLLGAPASTVADLGTDLIEGFDLGDKIYLDTTLFNVWNTDNTVRFAFLEEPLADAGTFSITSGLSNATGGIIAVGVAGVTTGTYTDFELWYTQDASNANVANSYRIAYVDDAANLTSVDMLAALNTL